jgi:UDP-glucose 4-epimerase
MLGTDQTLGAVALRGRRVLVTGARGFLGGALCRALSAGGAELYASSREHPLIDGDGGARWRRSDPADAAAAMTLIRDVAPEVIFHMSAAVNGSRNLAAVLPTFRDGLSSTVNLLTAAAEVGVDRFVLAGSVEARAQDGVPRSPYAASKAAATIYATMFGALFGLRCVDVRISMTYGPGQGDLKKLVPYVIEEARFGRSPSLGSGTRLADWIYVDDTVAALLAAADSPMAIGQSIELGTGILYRVQFENHGPGARPIADPRASLVPRTDMRLWFPNWTRFRCRNEPAARSWAVGRLSLRVMVCKRGPNGSAPGIIEGQPWSILLGSTCR